jgi:acyl-CoA synthetase (AMP-forming)/AMP-acid ligase II
MFTGSTPVRRFADTVLHRYAANRIAQLDRIEPVGIQRTSLRRLLDFARSTRFAKDHCFASIRTVADYQQNVPLRTYEQFWADYWKAVFPRIQGITWPEFTPYYAMSSGTTTGATKYVPVTRQMLESNKKGALTNLSFFLHQNPRAPVFQGRLFFLGGSTDLKPLPDGSSYGDLSGISVRELYDALRPYFFPTPDVALMGNWEEKVRVLARESTKLPVTVISGIPSWMLTLFDYLKKETGKDRIIDIWPNLQLLIHGGALFDPYRPIFREVIGSDSVKFQDTYPASEGYFASEDPRYGLLRLIYDHDIFYEFVPVDELDSANPTRHTLADFEVGVNYALVVTTCAGVWSYVVGDTIRFERRDPPLIRFTGRTKYFLNSFGEHVISEEVERAVAEAAAATDAQVVDFHVGPVFPDKPQAPGRHRYLIEFRKEPGSFSEFVRKLDDVMQHQNHDYHAYRVGSITLECAEVCVVRHGGFADWMKSRGKFGGQHKVPRMDNSGKITSEIIAFLGMNVRS